MNSPIPRTPSVPRGHEAYAYVENIRKYQISLVGYLQEKEKQATEAAMQLAQDYPALSPTELGKDWDHHFSNLKPNATSGQS
ncbi:hypothetical protein O5853_31300, partial [Escherichia coli]|nr:hypothetical protein [Escherichia coli]